MPLIGMALGAGYLYWIYLSFKLGSFWMFLVAAFPPTGLIIATPVGFWSMVSDTPSWVYSVFG